MDEHEWIKTNNVVCALLRQAHDVLAASSLPMKRPWVGLTGDEVKDLKHWLDHRAQWSYIEFARAIEAKLKEKNRG